jgi:hypothetical protein
MWPLKFLANIKIKKIVKNCQIKQLIITWLLRGIRHQRLQADKVLSKRVQLHYCKIQDLHQITSNPNLDLVWELLREIITTHLVSTILTEVVDKQCRVQVPRIDQLVAKPYFPSRTERATKQLLSQTKRVEIAK